MFSRTPAYLLVATIVVASSDCGHLSADPPKVLQLRSQKVGDTTYFHIRLQNPPDLAPPNTAEDSDLFLGRNPPRFDPLLMPRLVPQDSSAKAVYLRLSMDDLERRLGPGMRLPGGFDDPKFDDKKFEDKKPEDGEKKGTPKKEEKGVNGPGEEASGLEFVGKVAGAKKAGFVLVYPKAADEKAPPAQKGMPQPPSLAELLARKQAWGEERIEIDFAQAKNVAVPAGGFDRDTKPGPRANDLEGQWATAQAVHFALLEAETPEFGFYGIARESTGRKYKVPAPGAFMRAWRPGLRPDGGSHRLYEVTTGAAAITESLALDRMRGGVAKDRPEDRTVPIANVPGIEVAEHPWEKMMAGKKPAPEPLARLVPHDNYYIHFRNIAKLLEASDLLDQWGTTLVRVFESHSKDHHLKQRYEQQLCLKSSGLARTFGPAVIKSVAVTGNDPYVREGSDVTVLFHLANPALFKAAVEPFIKEARKKFGKNLKEAKGEHQGIAIESYVTPLREVSLHRAFVDDMAVYSNSPAGLRRVIDAAKGKLKPLADSLDFQYMRTVFRADDKDADGFVFLSDPFIRNLVGPSVRIKERRRLEALTSLQMITHGAMFTAWETGKLPINHDHLLQATGLKPEEVFTPGGGGAFWDHENKIAVSGIYNTPHFATPLIELPIDFVTPQEAQEYDDFRRQYLGLWRRYFDPIGMRLAIRKDEVRWETYILPLVRNSQYNDLRRITGEKNLKFDPAVFGDKTLAQFLIHLSPEMFRLPGTFLGAGAIDDLLIDVGLRSWMGDWATIRLDDSPIYAKLLEAMIRRELSPPGQRHDYLEDIELALQIPLTIGFEIRNPTVFAGLLATLRKEINSVLPGAVDWAPMEPYKDVSIVRIKSRPQPKGARLIEGPEGDRMPNFAIYYALIDSAFYVSLREEPIKDLIDRSIALKEKGANGKLSVEASASLHIAPGAAVQARELLTLYLEWEAHRRAQQSNRLLYALFRSNVASGAESSEAVEAAALQFLGYVPVSPDLAPFSYDPKYDEVANQRHGTLRKPKLNTGADSVAGQLLRQITSVRADLRFREDGVHTTVTLRREGKQEKE
jgi:hypothetical protein